jgi:PhoH-like ATPase
MPLPKPPTKKAAVLDPADYEAQAAPKPDKRTLKAPAAEAPRTALYDQSAAVAAAPVVAKPPAPAPAPSSAPVAQAAARPRRIARDTGPAKLFVLDTNVLMHDPMSLFRFAEHDIFLPMITLEELDGHKKGMSEVARNARQVSRELDKLATDG